MITGNGGQLRLRSVAREAGDQKRKDYEYDIKLKPNYKEVRQRPYPINPTLRTLFEQEMNSQMEAGLITYSDASWRSPIVIVKKKQQEGRPPRLRICCDMRAVNHEIEDNFWPLLDFSSIMQHMTENRFKYYLTLDFKSGFTQIKLNRRSSEILTMATPFQSYRPLRLPQGLNPSRTSHVPAKHRLGCRESACKTLPFSYKVLRKAPGMCRESAWLSTGKVPVINSAAPLIFREVL